ncbi:MAG: glycosyltransferase [Methylacidiphilales bacterium]|nr:glycosyltransferase [Candidatus Methylacidiphilales bacterium]
MLKCDLQAHSCHSDRPTQWVLRKLGVPESYTKPADLYDILKRKGFDFVTITDHNRLEGCLEIAGRPGVFLSETVTTYFPEDGCKIHILVWNLTEQDHRDIQGVRENIYELAPFLRGRGLAHGVAHPLLNINNRLAPEHVEKLVLLFRVFETANASRDPLAQQVLRLCLDSLTPEKIQQLADRHKIEPAHAEPWRKSFFGSSDDYGGLYLGDAWTEAEGGPDIADWLKRVENGGAVAGGCAGDVQRLANSIYRVVFAYARDRLGSTAPRGMQLLNKVAQRFLEGKNPTDFSFGELVGHVTEAVRTGKAFDFINPNETSLNREVVKYFLDPAIKKELDVIIREEKIPERRTFRMASKIANDLFYRLFAQVVSRINRGEVLDSLQPATGMLPLAASVAPYIFSYHNLHSQRPLLRSTARAFLGKTPPLLRNTKRAWFTDTLDDVNGVARTIRTMSEAAFRQGEDLTVIACRTNLNLSGIKIKNFAPVGEFELPEYKLQKLTFPPVLDIIDYIEREGFTECIISTPGPVGLTALAASKLLGLRTTGIYHTDFPQYVRFLTEDDFMETLMWKFMQWFYVQFDTVYVNSEFYRQCWIDRGLEPRKLAILPRGLDTELFHHRRRQKDYWKKRGAKGRVMLYVGRISKEKELRFLADVFRELLRRGAAVDLAVVGEGPYREEMQALAPKAIFTGTLTGEELGAAYASADLFVFPSTTDTFGNVVIEAMSSALPAFVSDVGGPKELVSAETGGRVLPAGDMDAWVAAIEEFLKNPVPAGVLESAARRIHEDRNWDRAFREFWANGLKEEEMMNSEVRIKNSESGKS